MEDPNTKNSPSPSAPSYFVKGVKRASFSSIPAAQPPAPSVAPLPVQPAPAPQPVTEAPQVTEAPPVTNTAFAQPAPVAAAEVVSQPTPTPVPVPVAQAVPQPSSPIAAAQTSPTPPVKEPVAAAPVASNIPRKAKKKNPMNVIMGLLLGLLVAGAAGGSFYMYWSSQQKLSNLEKASPQAYQDYQNKAIVDRVARHMDIPAETPIITTITDAAHLKQEPFYANVQDGDKVLVFSKRAILYDPERDRIVEVGFIRPETPTPVAQVDASGSGSESVAGASTAVETPTPTILINNEKNP